MEFGTVTVRGEEVSRLLTEMTGPSTGMNRSRYAAEAFSVIAWEHHDEWRTISDVMVVVIMHRMDARTCEVAIMAGGGKDGGLRIDWSVASTVASELFDTERGAEAAAFESAVESLERTCDELDLSIDTE